MISAIKAKYFRKHTDLSLSLTSGLNAVKGFNESGKSTIQEVILYSLYGAKALRTSLSDTVTWGHKESELKAEVTLSMNGKDYTFTRSKSGAECSYDGDLVTGQTEVSAFATELLGADYKTAGLLMMASQSGLRGALDEGPAAVSALISRLAEFDLIDTILERAGERLLTGGDQVARERLEKAQAERDTLKSELDKPDSQIPELEREHMKARSAARNLEIAINDVFRPQQNADYDLYQKLSAQMEERKVMSENLQKLYIDRDIAQGKVIECQKVIDQRPDPETLISLRVQVSEEGERRRRFDAYQFFSSLPQYPEVFWDEPQESFDAEYQKAFDAPAEIGSEIAGVDRAVHDLRAQVITGGQCPTCGHDVSDDVAVKEKNAVVEAKVNELLRVKAKLEATLKEAQDYLKDLTELKRTARSIQAVADRARGYVEVDASNYPVRVSWKGAVPGGNDSDQKALLAEMEAKERDAIRSEGQIEELSRTLESLKKNEATLTAVLTETPDCTHALGDAGKLYNESSALLSAKCDELVALQGTVTALQGRLDVLQRNKEMQQVQLQEAEKRVAQLQEDLKSLAFNNTLVKKLRGLKPTITDKLWTTVLAAASTFFSQMRGEKSLVTKDKDGFKVNGEAIESLSGSTLDVLALAIRVALSKTFIGGLSFMMLDEPGAGCDADRVMNMLGFLSSVGLTQVILATHDGVSESVADNVILLGE